MSKHIAWDYTVDNYQVYPISDKGEEIIQTITIIAPKSQKNNNIVQSISAMFEEACCAIIKIEKHP